MDIFWNYAFDQNTPNVLIINPLTANFNFQNAIFNRHRMSSGSVEKTILYQADQFPEYWFQKSGIFQFSIYTLSDLGVLSNLIGSLSLAN